MSTHRCKARLKLACLSVSLISLLAPQAAFPQSPESGETGETPPNIVIISIDDLGYADTQPFGSKINRTPHIQRMADEGCRLTSFYAAPVCSPSRASLMTGSYAKRALPIPHVLFPANAEGLAPDEITIAEVLKPAGYQTACIGKWHLGDQQPFWPTEQGFDTYFGLPYSNDMGPAWDGIKTNLDEPIPTQKNKARSQPPLPLIRNQTVLERVGPDTQQSLVERYTTEAVDFINANTTQPFFLYLPHSAVHFPIYPGKQFAGNSPHGYYSDWVEEVDWSVGKVLDALRNTGLAENTLVLFTSDNGGTRRGSNAPLRGFKGSTFEGGVRVCTIAWWPEKIKPSTSSDAVCGMIDVLPTCAALASVPVPDDRKIDGRSLLPVLLPSESGVASGTQATAQTTDNYKAVRDYYLLYKGLNLEAIRMGPWKYELTGPKLYNLAEDIGESNNIAQQEPDVIEQFEAIVASASNDLGLSGKGVGVRPLGRVRSPKPILNFDNEVRSDLQSKLKP